MWHIWFSETENIVTLFNSICYNYLILKFILMQSWMQRSYEGETQLTIALQVWFPLLHNAFYFWTEYLGKRLNADPGRQKLERQNLSWR